MKTHPLIQKVKNTIYTYQLLDPKKENHVVLGFSGGPDSVFLLEALLLLKEEFTISLTALHVNHCLRSDAKRDEAFSKQVAKVKNIPFVSYTYPVSWMAEAYKISIEEAGRWARYESFSREAKNGIIATGHHLDDNNETFMLNLARGTGLSGLSGIPIKRDNVIRPLLFCSKKEILDFLHMYDIPYILDHTNELSMYDRNKVRLEILPLFSELNPKFNHTLSHTIETIGKENAFLETIANEKKELYSRVLSDNSIYLDVDILREDMVIVHRVMIKMLESLDIVPIQKVHIEDMGHLLKKQTGKSIDLPKGYMVVKEPTGVLIRKKTQKPVPISYTIIPNETVFIEEENTYLWYTTDGTAPTKKTENSKKYFLSSMPAYTIRNRKKGDVAILQAGKKSLSRFLIDEKIPFYKRDALLFLAYGHDILAVVNNTFLSSKFIKYANDNVFIEVWEGL